MENQISNRRTDEQLGSLLYEADHWTVNGRQGQVLCSAASLHRAIDRAQQYAESGAVVTAICRQPSDNVIVFAEQMARLRRTIMVLELVAG
jgi:2-methylisocitrate lyase-like PEP mutase family enzyme